MADIKSVMTPAMLLDEATSILSFPLQQALRWCEYHTHTAVLFTVADLKTIFIPIVRKDSRLREDDPPDMYSVVRLRMRMCSPAQRSTSSHRIRLDLAAPVHVQRLEPGERPCRGRCEQTLAPASVETYHGATGNRPTLGHRCRVLRLLGAV